MENLKQNSDLVFPNEKVKQAVEKIIKDEGFISYEIKLNAGSNIGDNFLTIVYRATVTGKKTKDGKCEQLKLICKLSPTNALRREKFSVDEIFKREVLFYNEILPLIIKLQEEKGIVDEKFDYIPYVYVSSTEKLNEFIIMKDLRENGFTMFDRFQKIDFAHSELVMTALGKFHALSFAVRDIYPEIFEKYKELKEVKMMEKDMDFFIQGCIQNGIGSLKITEVDLLKKMEDVKMRYKDLFQEVVDGSKNEPYSVITHADTWTNNMMFKYENGIAIDIKLLDWQTYRYASPVLDILHFIFVCTENPFRMENYEKLLNIYYESLSKFLIRLDCDPERLFPYSAFQDQLKKYGIHGILIALFFVEIYLQQSEDCMSFDEIAKDLGDIDGFKKQHTNRFNKIKEVYNVRMADVITDINRLGYFDVLDVSE